MSELHLYPVDDPDNVLPDPKKYTCMFQYRTPGTLPANGRFVSCAARTATDACSSTQIPETFSIIQTNGEVWSSTDKQLFYDVLVHDKVFVRHGRKGMFTWLCNTSRLNSYFFVVVHKLYAAIEDHDDSGETYVDTVCENSDDFIVRSCMQKRTERRRRRGKTNGLARPSLCSRFVDFNRADNRANLSKHNDDDGDDNSTSVYREDTVERDPCGSLVSIYLNDTAYTSLIRNDVGSREMLIATMAFDKWRSLIRHLVFNNADVNRDISTFLLEPPDVFTHMPLKRALHERDDVRFNLNLYDFQSRTAHWMKQIEDDESGTERRLSLKSTESEWMSSANVRLRYCAEKGQLVVGRQLDEFPYDWRQSLHGEVGTHDTAAPDISSSIPTVSHYIPQNENAASHIRIGSEAECNRTILQETIDKRKHTTVRIDGGIICDATGTGKTVETLGLISLQSTTDKHRVLQTHSQTQQYAGLPRWRLPTNDLKRHEIHPYYFCAATLVVCPKQVCQQWIDQLEKACGEKSFRSLLIMKTDDARKVSLEDVLHHYDIVVINKSVFSQVRYREIVVRIPKPVFERLGWNKSSIESSFPSSYKTGEFEYTLKNDYLGTSGYFNGALFKLLELNHAATIDAPDLAPPGSFFPHFHANLCFWRRVVFDEVHELDKRWRLVERAACELRSQVRWGLTATPAFNSASSFGVGVPGGYLSLMRMDQGQKRHFRCGINRWQFVQKYTRRSGSVDMVPLQVRRVDVQMTPQEMAIYQSLDSVTTNTLLEFCCHHDISDDAWLRAFLPERIYRRHFDPTYVDDGRTGTVQQIEPHTVEEIATAMQSARQKQIASLENTTQTALSRWMDQEEKFSEFIKQEFGEHWSSAYRTSMWWLDTYSDSTPPNDMEENDLDEEPCVENGGSNEDNKDDTRKDAGKPIIEFKSRKATKGRVNGKKKLREQKLLAETEQEKQYVRVEEHRANRRSVRRQIFSFLDGFGNALSSAANIDAKFSAEANDDRSREKLYSQQPQENTAKRARLMQSSAAEKRKQPSDHSRSLHTRVLSSEQKRSCFTSMYTSQSNDFKSLERDLNALNRVRRQYKYYESIFEMLNNEKSITCAICLDAIPPKETVLTQCGHQFCMECIDACGNDRVRSERQRLQSELLRGVSSEEQNEMTIRCAQCRAQLRVLCDLKVIDRTATTADIQTEKDANERKKEKSGSSSNNNDIVESLTKHEDSMEVDSQQQNAETPRCSSSVTREDYSRYGSKIKRILEEIWTIQGLPDAKKIVVFAQSHHLLHLIGRALESFGLPFVYVEGRNSQRNIERFRKEERIRVILLSSEERKGSRSTISGLDLPEANYIIAAHPPMGYDEACYQTMKQAIGRIRRIGQTSDCHLLVMTTRNTIEETLYQNWYTYAQRRDRECGEAVLEQKRFVRTDS